MRVFICFRRFGNIVYCSVVIYIGSHQKLEETLWGNFQFWFWEPGNIKPKEKSWMRRFRGKVWKKLCELDCFSVLLPFSRCFPFCRKCNDTTFVHRLTQTKNERSTASRRETRHYGLTIWCPYPPRRSCVRDILLHFMNKTVFGQKNSKLSVLPSHVRECDRNSFIEWVQLIHSYLLSPPVCWPLFPSWK